MLKNYLKVALRIILRHKGYSLINITGLAIGMACCIVVWLYVGSERGYDTYHQDADRIFRVAMELSTSTGTSKYAVTAPPVAPTLRSEFPQVQYAARILYLETTRLVKRGDKMFYEGGFVYADQDIFNVLTIPFLRGNPEEALDRPGTLVIPQRLAQKYFGNEDPIGQTLNLDGRDHVITGVVGKPPANTHFQFDTFVSMEGLRDQAWMSDWTWPGMWTYVKLAPKVDAQTLERQIHNFADGHTQGDARAADKTYRFFMQPVADIHLKSNLEYETPGPGNPLYLLIFSLVGLFILLIACMNFMNLTTAMSAGRSKEVATRKAVGAGRSQLIVQFLGESLIQSILAMILALAIVELAKPLFSDLLGTELRVISLLQPTVLLGTSGLVLVVSLLAGGYPAIILSSVEPAKVIRRQLGSAAGDTVLRRILVVVQFSISIVLLTGTITAFQQLDFMRNKDLGFVQEQKLIIPVRGRAPLAGNYESVKDEFLKHPSVMGACVSGSVPGEGAANLRTGLVGEENPRNQMMYYLFTDADFLSEYGIETVAGRGFRKDRASDVSGACMVNEASVKALGWSSAEEAVGKRLETGMTGSQKQIIGVTKDFHYRSLHFAVEPLVIEIVPTVFQDISLTVDTENLDETVSFVEQTWRRLFPGKPFEYFFLDGFFQQLYRSEQQVGRLFTALTVLGIFIACLGLFGLVSFISQQRTKEIGIRKVLGATVTGIVHLISKEFLILVALANVIAWPVAYYAMSKWLQNFAYRIQIGWGTFILAGILALLIALITVSFQAVKAALANPVEALRYE